MYRKEPVYFLCYCFSRSVDAWWLSFLSYRIRKGNYRGEWSRTTFSFSKILPLKGATWVLTSYTVRWDHFLSASGF